MKVSSTGDSLWTKTYGSGIGYSLTLAADNSVAISGSKIDGNDNFENSIKILYQHDHQLQRTTSRFLHA
jgi:hypothetical protein